MAQSGFISLRGDDPTNHVLRYCSDANGSYFVVLPADAHGHPEPSAVSKLPVRLRGGSSLPLRLTPADCRFSVLTWIPALFASVPEVILSIMIFASGFTIEGIGRGGDGAGERHDRDVHGAGPGACFDVTSPAGFDTVTTIHVAGVWIFVALMLVLAFDTVRGPCNFARLSWFYVKTNAMLSAVSLALAVTSIAVVASNSYDPGPDSTETVRASPRIARYIVTGTIGLSVSPVLFPLLDICSVRLRKSKALAFTAAAWLLTLIRYYLTALAMTHSCEDFTSDQNAGQGSLARSVLVTAYISIAGASIVELIPLIKHKLFNPDRALLKLSIASAFSVIVESSTDDESVNPIANTMNQPLVARPFTDVVE